MLAVCPWCQAPRDAGPNCPKCGANYAKAEAIRKQGRAMDPPPAPPPTEPVDAASAAGLAAGSLIEDEEKVEDPDLEWKLCAGALPVMLLVALAFHGSELGHFLQRTFLAMPVHELGHAVTAWFCGYAAIPTLWRTHVPETRGIVAPLVLLGAIGFMMYRACLAQNRVLLLLGGALVLLLAFGTFGIKHQTAQMLITFGGDGLGMILGVLLMATFFFGKGKQLYQGGLRWGFLAIGAAAYVDLSGTWWAARKDFGRIPFGEMEGTGTSDATRLVDDFGWSADQMIQRYVMVGACCLLAIMVIYVWGVWQAKRDAGAANRRG